MVEGDLLHLWHGNPGHRKWFQRHSDLQPYHFDPLVDIARSESGCWRWNTAKPAMHEYVRGYFASRCEDRLDSAVAIG